MSAIDIAYMEYPSTDPTANLLGHHGYLTGTRTDGTRWRIYIDEEGSPMNYWRDLEPEVCPDPVDLYTDDQVLRARDRMARREEIYPDHPLVKAWEEFQKEEGGDV